jgi:hypothetical protein
MICSAHDYEEASVIFWCTCPSHVQQLVTVLDPHVYLGYLTKYHLYSKATLASGGHHPKATWCMIHQATNAQRPYIKHILSKKSTSELHAYLYSTSLTSTDCSTCSCTTHGMAPYGVLLCSWRMTDIITKCVVVKLSSLWICRTMGHASQDTSDVRLLPADHDTNNCRGVLGILSPERMSVLRQVWTWCGHSHREQGKRKHPNHTSTAEGVHHRATLLALSGKSVWGVTKNL